METTTTTEPTTTTTAPPTTSPPVFAPVTVLTKPTWAPGGGTVLVGGEAVVAYLQAQGLPVTDAMPMADGQYYLTITDPNRVAAVVAALNALNPSGDDALDPLERKTRRRITEAKQAARALRDASPPTLPLLKAAILKLAVLVLDDEDA